MMARNDDNEVTAFGDTDHTTTDGVWIGIDFGTTNCACAVWDSSQGRAKVLRLERIARPALQNKHGRIVPSVVLVSSSKTDQDDNDCDGSILGEKLSSVAGQEAMQALQESVEEEDSKVPTATVTSVKRVLGMTSLDRDFLDSLPFDCIQKQDGGVSIELIPLGSSDKVILQPVQIVAILLRSIRMGAQTYLDTTGKKKKLAVPSKSNDIVKNCVVGVPAHFGQSQRALIKQACRMAGFVGHVSTVMESTAAAMAYGLFVSTKQKKNILVFDMGGGTTDVTIATMQEEEEESEFLQVVITEGDGQLGGNDMDELLLGVVLEKLNRTEFPPQQHRSLLLECRRGKEELCSSNSGGAEDATTTIISVDKHCSVTVSMQEFNTAIAPLVERARRLVVDQALARFAKNSSHSIITKIHEVVLVGGATRVPLVRDMLRQVFHSVELCCSLNAESAVAQGAAIQAAIRSNLVPKHELRSALMLDALPHTIGVLGGGDAFVPILQKDTPLPAMGHATFTLANVHQAGVTVVAAEQVKDGENETLLQDLGSFTFLLRRLSDEILESLDNQRTVDIGMTLETSGKFIVSIFDWNDPEHLEKKRRYQQENHDASKANLGYNEEDITMRQNKTVCDQIPIEAEENVTMEQVLLFVACGMLFLLYIAVKIAFSEAPEESARIL